MLVRTAKNQSQADVRFQFSAVVAMFLSAAIVISIAILFTIHPQLRRTAAWMPYDTTKEIRIAGVVEDFKVGQCPWCGPGPGAHVLVRTRDGPIEVHLAEAKFLRDHGFVFVKGDPVEVLGAKLVYDGGSALLAREVTLATCTIVLRDARGNPLWLTE